MLRSFLVLLVSFLLTVASWAQSMPGTSSPDAQGGFSASLVVHGETVYVGEASNNLRPGTVYIYDRGTDGAWTESMRLTSSDSFMGDGFGTAMARWQDLMAVTATSQDEGRGAVYLFDVADGGASELARLTPVDTMDVSGFGSSVAIGPNILIVGASDINEEAGAAYVFEPGQDGVWTQTARLVPEDVEAGSRFGASLGVSGGHILAGAPGHDGREGVVFVFGREDGEWTEVDDLSEREIERNDRYGSRLTVVGDRAYVAAPFAQRSTGVAYVYERDEDGDWDDAGKLLPFDASTNLRFGMSMAVAGNDVWIGAPGANGFEGAIYAATRNDAGVFTGVDKIFAPEPTQGHLFAASLAVGENIAAVGTPGKGSGAGGVLIYERVDGAWVSVASYTPPHDALDSMTGGETLCEDGEAGLFTCEQVDMLSFMSVKDIGARPGIKVNDVWGWTDPETGREYAIVGRNDGTSFLDVSDPLNPRYLGDLPKTEGSNTATWRDMKVYSNHVYVVADGAGQHGMQIFDLTRLRDVGDEPVQFDADAHYDNIASAHNIVINEASGFAYAVGASSGGETCGGGLHMIDIREPAAPEFAGCFADEETGRAGTGYSHDAQCFEYDGPDQEYVGDEICVGANETALSIANVSDKQNPVKISSAAYPNVGYSHQGWISEDHRYFYSNDELDELQGKVTQTRTLIWDVTDLDDPQLVKEYMAPTKSSDHNLYIKGNLMYQSNYVSGLRVLDISDPENPVEVGHFDTVPYGTNDAGFDGSWSNYPFFESGTIIVTSGNEGVFMLKKREVDI